mmetsp:Transcript_87057/g.191264  ORF Transcript_87057/g.191264 Transcript_87057/m.191264 type:complete len:273 (+) Transcript_87057:529-1347(+)
MAPPNMPLLNSWKTRARIGGGTISRLCVTCSQISWMIHFITVKAMSDDRDRAFSSFSLNVPMIVGLKSASERVSPNFDERSEGRICETRALEELKRLEAICSLSRLGGDSELCSISTAPEFELERPDDRLSRTASSWLSIVDRLVLLTSKLLVGLRTMLNLCCNGHLRSPPASCAEDSSALPSSVACNLSTERAFSKENQCNIRALQCCSSRMPARSPFRCNSSMLTSTKQNVEVHASRHLENMIVVSVMPEKKRPKDMVVRMTMTKPRIVA